RARVHRDPAVKEIVFGAQLIAPQRVRFDVDRSGDVTGGYQAGRLIIDAAGAVALSRGDVIETGVVRLPGESHLGSDGIGGCAAGETRVAAVERSGEKQSGVCLVMSIAQAESGLQGLSQLDVGIPEQSDLLVIGRTVGPVHIRT